MIKYLDNKEEHGIDYDWNLIFREFKKLKIPKELYDPTTAPVDKAKWFIELSERATGKTTNWLLIGMIMNKYYGTIIQYIRQSSDMIKPSVAGNIFDVIRTYDEGKYIKAITDGKYNSVYIHWKKAYYCIVDENNRMIEQAPEPFLQFLSIDESFNYKSTYNAPTGDLLLFDEFIGKNYYVNEFVTFCDLCSTIIRKRKSPIIIMLANTINYNSQYFKELEISKEVRNIKVGQNRVITTEKGTKIYVEIIGTKQTTIKQQVNRLFYGFNNPKLISITGGEETWSFDPVPHIVNNETDELLFRNVKVDCGDLFLQIDVVRTEDRGIICNVHECNQRIHDDTIVLTNGDIENIHQRFGLGTGKLCNAIWKLYKENKFYYDSNETGSLIDNYVKTYLKVRK